MFLISNPIYVDYHRKWANALLASAILWVSSLFLTADPSPRKAAIISAANLSAMVGSERERE
jgi:hypothetical protein